MDLKLGTANHHDMGRYKDVRKNRFGFRYKLGYIEDRNLQNGMVWRKNAGHKTMVSRNVFRKKFRQYDMRHFYAIRGYRGTIFPLGQCRVDSFLHYDNDA